MGYNFGNDFTYKQTERGFFNRSACDQDHAWMELVYNGTWEDRGIHADSSDDSKVSLVSMYIETVTLSSLVDEVCLETSDGSIKCIDTIGAKSEICPCNGWDWSIDGNSSEPSVRDVRERCMPQSECPILHQVLVEQMHYLAY